MRRVIGVIEGEHKGSGRFGGARDEGLAQRVGESREVLAVDAGCQT
jgi:hypothetical protein